MFAATIGAIHIGLFDVISSSYALIFALIILLSAFIFAYKVLGNPFSKDEKNDKEQN